MPMPIICSDVHKPNAVPTTFELTTRGIVGHMLDCKQWNDIHEGTVAHCDIVLTAANE
jgi:hypothetical protein